MADDLKELRDQFQADVDEWREPRDERAKDMRYLAGDPWEPADKQRRKDAGRPYMAFDELNQYVNQVVNDLRANPRAIAFAPAADETSGERDPEAAEKRSMLYADKTREIEYRSNAKQAYTLAAENAIQGGYGFVQVTSKYAPKSVRNQEIWIEPLPDPDCVIADPFHLRPDGSDMKRAFVLEHRRLSDFQAEFPDASTESFDGYYQDASYKNWIQPDRITLASAWKVIERKRRLLIAQPPAVMPPPGQMDLRGPSLPPTVEVWADEWKDARLPQGTQVLDEREADDPRVIMQLVNGVEILEEQTDWPGTYIPIIPCYGRVLFTPEGARTKRLLLSMIRLARDPYMAYCYAGTGAMEVAGSTTKNPYWAYEGQLDQTQLNEIGKSVHEPVAVLFAKAMTAATGQQVLPLPQRNQLSPDLNGWAVLMETTRRAIQAAIAANFLPTQAQRRNEKSGKALEQIDRTAQKGTFHFIDHYEGMIRQTGVVIEDLFDHIYDTRRQIGVRKADDTTSAIWINDPSNPEAIDTKGRHAVTVSSGPDFDSTREAASEFADNLLENQVLMQLVGPQKAQKLAALAIKLKVRETGIGDIGEQIVDIIAPPEPGQKLTPEQLQQQNAELQQQLEQAKQIIEQAAKEAESGLAKEKAKTERDTMLAQMDERLQTFLQQLKGQQAEQQIALKGRVDLDKQNDAQAHDAATGAAEAAHDQQQADKAMLAALAKQPAESGSPKPNGNGAGA